MTTMNIEVKQRSRAHSQKPESLSLTIFLILALAFGGAGCDHDPLVLERHPLDTQAATGRDFQSQYIEMTDGIRIAVDVYVPTGYPGVDTFPTIIELTRYWRDRGDGLSYFPARAVQQGFAYVIIDERGTGASFGSWDFPLTDRALADAGEVMDWIVQQPWSNGLVGATGVSYPGMSAQQLAAMGHPALKAIVPQSDTWDQYEDLIFPGGMFNQFFMQNWSDIVFEMDRSTSMQYEGQTFRLRPVDADPSQTLLQEAVAGHAGNLVVLDAVETITFRDDLTGPGKTLDDMSTHSKAQELGASGVAIYAWGSWMDGGSADGVIRGFMSSTGPRRAVIGSWNHGLGSNSNPFNTNQGETVPSEYLLVEEALHFFDDILKNRNPLQERILRYYTMGENLWKSTDRWPLPETENLRFYLQEGGSLSTSTPSQAEGEDTFTVDFTHRSAPESRWMGPVTGNSWYSSRGNEDEKLLVYETAPLAADMEVTGYPVVNLLASSDAYDGAFFVYLEDVSPSGRVTYITEGILRGMHRKVVDDPSYGWDRPTPYHSYLARDAQPMVPGEIMELAFGMHPTSALFLEGHRIRISIAGHDESVFRRVPEEGTPEIRIQRNATHTSWVELPVIPNQDPGGE